jgi:hypothetical protein
MFGGGNRIPPMPQPAPSPLAFSSHSSFCPFVPLYSLRTRSRNFPFRSEGVLASESCALLSLTRDLGSQATWTQLKRKLVTAGAFFGILLTCNVPLVTIIVKVEQPRVTLSWGGAYTPLLLVLLVAIGLAVRHWYSLLQYRTLAGRWGLLLL